MTSAAQVIEQREAAPFLKWVGGKRQLLPEILRVLPRGRIRRYAEPFVGGGAVFFELARLDRIESAILCDTNVDLIAAYRAVKEVPEQLIDALRQHKNTETHYYSVRSLDPDSLSLPERAARTIYLNRCGYNGLYRVNLSGRFNVPFGRYSNPRICDVEGLLVASKALQCADIRVADFEKAVAELQRGDVAYFDPPYVPLSVTSSFTAYTRHGFAIDDQRRLRDVAAGLKKRRIRVVLSNSSAPAVREIYGVGFSFVEVSATRMVNCNGDARGRVSELLIT